MKKGLISLVLAAMAVVVGYCCLSGREPSRLSDGELSQIMGKADDGWANHCATSTNPTDWVYTCAASNDFNCIQSSASACPSEVWDESELVIKPVYKSTAETGKNLLTGQVFNCAVLRSVAAGEIIPLQDCLPTSVSSPYTAWYSCQSASASCRKCSAIGGYSRTYNVYIDICVTHS